MTLFDGGYGRFVKFKTETLFVSTLCPTIFVQHIIVKAQLLDIYKQQNRWNSDFFFSQILFLIEVLFAELKYLKFKFYSLVNIISQHIFYWFYFTFSLKIIVWHTLKAVNENSMLCIFLVPLPFIIFLSVLMELNHLYYFYSKENLNQCKLLRKFSAIFPKKCLMTIIS